MADTKHSVDAPAATRTAEAGATPEASPLGRSVSYSSNYDPDLLYPIARVTQRREIGVGDDLPFCGADLWTAWELSWLDGRGKPVVAVARFSVPASSPNLIESKSLKLYLNSFSATRMESPRAVAERIGADLSQAAGGAVNVDLCAVDSSDLDIRATTGRCIDALDVECSIYGPPDPELLRCEGDEVISETLYSHLLKSNCPVTAQPDWATLRVEYRGPRIDPASLLRYIVSFREHNDFHEQCVERIFVDLQRRCQPEALVVMASYTRRGGLDINPYRSSDKACKPLRLRTHRQ